MPRPKNTVSEEHLKKLKTLIDQTFGNPLTRSCETEQLSSDIKKVTGALISPHTLRRFFGFLETGFSPSLKTLNTLSNYVGYSNWYSLTHGASDNYEPMTLSQEAEMYLGFYKIEVKAEKDMNYHNAARNIALRIVSNTALLSHLMPQLAKHPVSQVYFFEHFPFIDGLCTDYKRGIQLYLQKKEAGAQIFGNSLLFLSAFLSGKKKESKTYLERMDAFTLQHSMHPFTVARFIGSHILFEGQNSYKQLDWLSEADKWNQYFLKKGNVGFWYYPYFQHMICDYLNLAGLYEYSQRYVATIRGFSRKYEIENGYEDTLQVIQKIACHRQSKDSYKKWIKSGACFQSIHPLSKKYIRIQALCAYYSLLDNRTSKLRIANEINGLINETGFTYFNQCLNDADR